MPTTILPIRITFTQPLLGSAPKTDIYRDWIATRNPDPNGADEETATAPANLDKGVTGFHRLEDSYAFYDYVVLGFFKEACSALRRIPDSLSAKVKAHRQIIDTLIFVNPRLIRLIPPAGWNGEMELLSRPLRAQTAQGERVTIAVSEMLPAGTAAEFEIELLGGVTIENVREWLDYGSRRGLGQWRNGRYGTFTWQEITKP